MAKRMGLFNQRVKANEDKWEVIEGEGASMIWMNKETGDMYNVAGIKIGNKHDNDNKKQDNDNKFPIK